MDTSPTRIPFAPFFKRFTALLIDVLLLGVALSILRILDFQNYYYYVAINLLLLLYRPLMESSRFQATLGKLIMGLKVSNLHLEKINFNQAVLRSSLFIIPTILSFPLNEIIINSGLLGQIQDLESFAEILKKIETLFVDQDKYENLQLLINMIYFNNLLFYMLDLRYQKRSLHDRFAKTYVIQK